MKRNALISRATLAALCMAGLAVTNVASAFNMSNMFNPSRWFGNSDHDRYRYGGYGPYGWGGGPYGWGGGPYGWGGGPYGWGGGPYGWGGPYGGYGGYGNQQPQTIVVNPPDGSKKGRAPE